jgi:voltage-gated potassium channel
MIVLGLLWLLLLVVEFVWGLSPALEFIGGAIWVVFLADFLVKLLLSPRKIEYLKRNWLTALALMAPALRLLRVARAVSAFRAARAVRGARMIRVLASVNRGMRALGATMNRRGFGYVAALTLIVLFAGSAGMYAFESESPGGLENYGAALWWTAMMLTTMGSDSWPQTGEGRVLCLLLAVYAFAVWGYVTATIATFFIGRDAEAQGGGAAGRAMIAALEREIASLRREVQELGRNLDRPPHGAA